MDVELDQLNFGFGFRNEVNASTDFFASVSYEVADISIADEGVDDDGFAVDFGLRSMFGENLELGASANNDLDGVEGHSDDFTAMVRMRYNLYRGGIDVGRQQEAMERSSESKQRKMRF